MKKRFAKLSKAEQDQVSLEYHNMNPDEFQGVMSRATQHSPTTIRLSPSLVKRLKSIAEHEGEPEYQLMVKRWVEERLKQEVNLAQKSSRKRISPGTSASRKHVTK